MASAAVDQVVAAFVTEGVIAAAPFEVVVATPALNQVAGFGTDDKGAALVGFGVAVQILDPGRATGDVGQVADDDGRVLRRPFIECRVQHPAQAIAVSGGQMRQPGDDVGNRVRQQVPGIRGVVVVEVDDVVGARGLGGIMYAEGCPVGFRAVEGAEHRVVLVADVQHLAAVAGLGR
ncbi:hypothetical protein D3C85_1273860 [compost metagenome]